MKAAYKIHWTEYELGWGQRPDGTTIHKDKQSADKFVLDYNIRNRVETTSDIYSRAGLPVLCEVPADIYERLQTEPSFWWHHTRWM